jgi:hypothetical protein
MDNTDFPLVTRRAGIELVQRQLGIPLKKTVVNNAVAAGTGPTPVGRYGNCDLFRPNEFLDWARSLVKPR